MVLWMSVANVEDVFFTRLALRDEQIRLKFPSPETMLGECHRIKNIHAAHPDSPRHDVLAVIFWQVPQEISVQALLPFCALFL